MNDKVMRQILLNIKSNNPLSHYSHLSETEYQSLIDGYNLNYFANMHIKRISSNKIKVEAFDQSKPITLTEIGERALFELDNSPNPKPIGFKRD
ncbi:hypothetical protein [Enterococcus casseliflavus]|uniref:hypothetical protein n=1 Tax=Enterococcus casseliflavus TaxID=37734 RepID=UPI003D6AB085